MYLYFFQYFQDTQAVAILGQSLSFSCAENLQFWEFSKIRLQVLIHLNLIKKYFINCQRETDGCYSCYLSPFNGPLRID